MSKARYEIRIGLESETFNWDDPVVEVRQMLQSLIDEMVDGGPLPNRVLRDTGGNRVGSANTYGTDNPEAGDPK